ncbi:MAG: hypothetical protein IAE97_09990 [Chthoniobacterales bacterium]|nr:hypothetical protein [Chthoniobacterales bacterium]
MSLPFVRWAGRDTAVIDPLPAEVSSTQDQGAWVFRIKRENLPKSVE